MKVFCFYIILMLVVCSSCKTDILSPKEELPAATQEGLNTFGCLVNGEVWIPKRIYNKLEYFYYENDGSFNVTAYKKIGSNDINQELGFGVLEGLIAEDSYILSNLETTKSMAGFNNYNLNCYYETNPKQAGTLSIIKLDTANHIIAGTFEFTVWTEECDTIKVTDGRFDIKYRQ